MCFQRVRLTLQQQSLPFPSSFQAQLSRLLGPTDSSCKWIYEQNFRLKEAKCVIFTASYPSIFTFIFTRIIFIVIASKSFTLCRIQRKFYLSIHLVIWRKIDRANCKSGLKYLHSQWIRWIFFFFRRGHVCLFSLRRGFLR